MVCNDNKSYPWSCYDIVRTKERNEVEQALPREGGVIDIRSDESHHCEAVFSLC